MKAILLILPFFSFCTMIEKDPGLVKNSFELGEEIIKDVEE